MRERTAKYKDMHAHTKKQQMSTQNMTTGPVTIPGDPYGFTECRQYPPSAEYPNGRISGLLSNCNDDILKTMLDDMMAQGKKNLTYNNLAYRISEYNNNIYVWITTTEERNKWLKEHGYTKGGKGGSVQAMKSQEPVQNTPREYQFIKMIPPVGNMGEEGYVPGEGLDQIRAYAADSYRVVQMAPMHYDGKDIVIVAMER